MRNFINIILEHSHEEPEFFYHGTNIVAAASILRGNRIEAAEQDEHHEGNHHSVSLTTDPEKGADFAIGYVRWNSEMEVGVVFKLDAKAIMQNQYCVPFEAETAGVYEYEYRTWGDISPLSKYLIDYEVVGDLASIMGDSYRDPDDDEDDFEGSDSGFDRREMMAAYDNYGRYHFADVDDMEEAISEVLQK